MNRPWSNLPNAHHIDWVLRSLKDNPDLWDAAYDAAYDAAWDVAYDAACGAARDASWSVIRAAACGEARAAAWGAALALIAYNDCDQYLAMSYEDLTIWAALSEHSAAFLLLPMVYVRENLHEPALV